VTLADAPKPRGGWWAEDGTIVFTPSNRVGVMRVSSVGGPAQPLTTLVNGEITHRFPQVLPGGSAVLYTASTESEIDAGATLVVQPLPSGQRTVIHRGGYFGRYVASGHVVYMQDDGLFALPFDRRKLVVTGAAGRTTAVVRSHATRGSAQLAVSQVGTLAYLPAATPSPRFVAFSPTGATLTSLPTGGTSRSTSGARDRVISGSMTGREIRSRG
jgi:hypothetical protein